MIIKIVNKLTLYINMILYGIVDFSMNVHVQSNCKVAT